MAKHSYTHFISFSYVIAGKQAAIYPVLQSSPTQVNEVAGYSAIAPQVSKISPRDFAKALHRNGPYHFFGSYLDG